MKSFLFSLPEKTVMEIIFFLLNFLPQNMVEIDSSISKHLFISIPLRSWRVSPGSSLTKDVDNMSNL